MLRHWELSELSWPRFWYRWVLDWSSLLGSQVEQADLGSIFLGVAEKLGVPGDDKYMPRLTRWQGWGFVNYRAVRNKEHEQCTVNISPTILLA